MKRKRLSTVAVLAVLLVSAVAIGVSPSVVATDGDDAGDDKPAATKLTPGSTATDAITAGDVDWYSFDAEKGDRLFVELTALTEEYDQLRMEFYAPDGSELGEAGESTGNPQKLDVDRGPTAWGGDIAPTSGTYFVKIEPWVSDGTTSTEYELAVETKSLDADRPGDTPTTAVSIDGNATVSGTMSGQDVDTYAIDLAEGETIEASIESETDALGNIQLVEPSASEYMHNGYNEQYDLSGGPALNDAFSYMASENATHYLRVYPGNNSKEWFTRSSSYELSVSVSSNESNVPADEVGDSRSEATTMDANATTSGTIFGTDADWYAFDASAGQSIGVELTATTANEEDLVFSLYNPDGDEIGAYPNDALHPAYHTDRIATGPWTGGGDTAIQSGTYYVKVSGAGPVSSTAYNLSVQTRPLDDHEPDEQPSMAGSISDDGSVDGVMTGSDADTYKIDLDKGDRVRATLDRRGGFGVHTQLLGPDTPDTLQSESEWEYDVSEWTVEGFNATINESGTYYVRVYPVENGVYSFFETVDYTLSVSVAGNGEETDTEETPDNETETPTEDTDTQPKDTETETEGTQTSTEDTPTDEQMTPESTPDDSTQSNGDSVTKSDDAGQPDSVDTESNDSEREVSAPPC